MVFAVIVVVVFIVVMGNLPRGEPGGGFVAGGTVGVVQDEFSTSEDWFS